MAETNGVLIGQGVDLRKRTGLPARLSPAMRADEMAKFCDQMAAVVEGMLESRVVTPAGLMQLRDGWAALHVQADELAQSWRVARSRRLRAVAAVDVPRLRGVTEDRGGNELDSRHVGDSGYRSARPAALGAGSVKTSMARGM